ncbi:hypothetical protein [Candidatus Arsenophonus triatominarum]|uniref:hypothetical protein n=1 Tax=Candidatus Arsenophonus triatominarum TaxID=57911 RepID=UPI0007C5CB6A|nr:hypothetical protein [Candidatus Arsenophonus triatominarum]
MKQIPKTRNVTTDNNGKAIFSIVSEQAGQMKITANINGSNTEKLLLFLADVSTAEIGSVKLDDTTTTKIEMAISILPIPHNW